MKVKRSIYPMFEPVTIEVTFNSIEELKALKGRLGLTQSFINKQFTTGACQPIDSFKYTAHEDTELDELTDIIDELIDDIL